MCTCVRFIFMFRWFACADMREEERSLCRERGEREEKRNRIGLRRGGSF